MCPRPIPRDSFPKTYCLIAPERAQMTKDIATSLKNVAMFFEEGDERWLWYLFGRPVAGERERRWVGRSDGKGNMKMSRLEELPNELLDIIIELLDKQGVLALGLSSAVFWPIVLHHVHTTYRNQVGSWAGLRVAFQGSYSYSLPQPFYDEELNKIIDPSTYSIRLWTWRWSSRFESGRNLNYITPSEQEWLDIATAAEQRNWYPFLPADWVNIKQDLSCSYMFPQDRVWVLRNLTTREYVRSDQLCPKLKQPKKRRMRFSASITFLNLFDRSPKPIPKLPFDESPVTLGQVLLLLTCWSTSIQWPEPMLHFQQGVWAGHQFDLVALDEHYDAPDAADWANVSEAAVHDAANVRTWANHLVGNGFRADRGNSGHWNMMKEQRLKYHHWCGKPGEESNFGRPKNF
ncbi:hypothetical protein CC78DRAFT_564924 [Lojkania enalia]|uniref:F-box domain-containing protein n=1 Tax=Lojkania enalia TaxID=147567 RepID=A0A9P4TN26_9PLEO|nr:hypothetical protein CC78DRAFT_564924 [Didymosphaeria enalia]